MEQRLKIADACGKALVQRANLSLGMLRLISGLQRGVDQRDQHEAKYDEKNESGDLGRIAANGNADGRIQEKEDPRDGKHRGGESRSPAEKPGAQEDRRIESGERNLPSQDRVEGQPQQ